jgi:hypothetical protein
MAARAIADPAEPAPPVVSPVVCPAGVVTAVVHRVLQRLGWLLMETLVGVVETNLKNLAHRWFPSGSLQDRADIGE